jgi:hypothetical protein
MNDYDDDINIGLHHMHETRSILIQHAHAVK